MLENMEMEIMQKGCLVVHGLTGTPENMTSISKALEAKGYRVKTPLLHGHGIDLKTLSRTTWMEWYESLYRAYTELSKEVKKVYFAGLSMGALLGLKLAADIGNSLKAVALLGPPFRVKPLFASLVIPGVRYTPLRFFIRSTAKNFEKSVLDPKGREYYRQNSIPRMPSACVFQCEDLVKHLEKELPKIKQPLILIGGHRDHLVDSKGYLEIKNLVGSKKVDIVMMERSAHVLTVDYEKESVAQKVIEFFETSASV